MKVFAAQLNLTIGDLDGNTQKILQALVRAKKQGVDVVLFSELTITGYCPEDLLLYDAFIDEANKKLEEIRPFTKELFVVVGVPRYNVEKKEKFLYNSAAVFSNGEILGFKDKVLLPTYDVFDERRFFEPGNGGLIWEHLGYRIGVTICEDVWEHSKAVEETNYRLDPVMELRELRPDLVLNLSASPYYYNRKETRLSVFQAVAKTLSAPVILCNQVGCNDQVVCDGYSLYVNERGELIQIAKGFEEDDLIVDLNTHACPCNLPENGMKDLRAALRLGIQDYFSKLGFTKAIIGISGGIDSAVVACLAQEALGAANVVALTLPARYSSRAAVSDAEQLCHNLKIQLKKVDIDPIFENYLTFLSGLFEKECNDITEQNLQSRIRTMILMAFSNQSDFILLNTSNKSEIAVGYSTLYGDMAGGLAVLQDVVKGRVYGLARLINTKHEIIPKSILEKIPSAELKAHQTDFDVLPPYEVLDLIIEDYVELFLSPEEIALKRGFDLELVSKWVHKIHLAEYKRRQAPVGIRVTQRAFGKGRSVPVVQKWK